MGSTLLDFVFVGGHPGRHTGGVALGGHGLLDHGLLYHGGLLDIRLLHHGGLLDIGGLDWLTDDLGGLEGSLTYHGALADDPAAGQVGGKDGGLLDDGGLGNDRGLLHHGGLGSLDWHLGHGGPVADDLAGPTLQHHTLPAGVLHSHRSSLASAHTLSALGH